MFASQLGKQDANSNSIYTLTPFDESLMQRISFEGNLQHGINSYAVRPSITLNANVYITGGKGTVDSPYTIAMS